MVVVCFSRPLGSSVELPEQPPAASSLTISSGADLLWGQSLPFISNSFFPFHSLLWDCPPAFSRLVLVLAALLQVLSAVVALPSSRFILGSALAVFSVVKCKQRWANTARELQNSGKSGYSSKALRPTWDLEL